MKDEKIVRVVEQASKLKEVMQKVATPQKKIPNVDPEPVLENRVPALNGRVAEILGVLQPKVDSVHVEPDHQKGNMP